jgi:dTDP-3-amino-3,4,6-trideoxy-alpha-D-glucose transaminase
MRKVEFVDLQPYNRDVAVLEAIQTVVESGWFISGPEVVDFEVEWARYCGAARCVAVGSGGAALTIALKALDVPPGARVVMPALSFAATAMATLQAGAQPVYCDVDERGLMDLSDAAHVAESERAWGIMPVHLYGQVVDMCQVMEIAYALHLRVVEDACQAHGMKKVWGDAACFSFYPSKNLGALGDAGAIVTNHEHMADKCMGLRDYGRIKRKFSHLLLGGNQRMDEIQAAVLRVKLPSLDEWNAARALMARAYESLDVPSIARSPSHWHLYPVRCDEPEQVRQMLRERGVMTGRHYPHVMPEMPALFMPGNWPRAVDIARHHITLPMGPHLDAEDVAYVAEKFLEVTE